MRYKYPFDLTVMVLILVPFAPIWICIVVYIMASIWLTDRGPIFYTQYRYGKNRKIFKVYKFRTIDIQGLEITKLGKFLRKTELDEMPQVLNVLMGDMSLVGPRPFAVEEAVAIEKEMPEFAKRLQVKPGIAGLAQIHAPEPSSSRAKLAYDKLYIANMGIKLDIYLILKCITEIVCG